MTQKKNKGYVLDPEMREAYRFVDEAVKTADGTCCGAPWFYGHVLRKAFCAGVEWADAREKKS